MVPGISVLRDGRLMSGCVMICTNNLLGNESEKKVMISGISDSGKRGAPDFPTLNFFPFGRLWD